MNPISQFKKTIKNKIHLNFCFGNAMTENTAQTIEFIMYNNWINKAKNNDNDDEHDGNNRNCHQKAIPIQCVTWYLFLILSLFGQSFGGALFGSNANNAWKQLLSFTLLIYDLFAFIALLIIYLSLNSDYSINVIFNDSLNNKSLVFILLRAFFYLLIIDYIAIKLSTMYFGPRIAKRIDKIGMDMINQFENLLILNSFSH